jgi:ubiquitin-like 1-activating enzyme E1 A
MVLFDGDTMEAPMYALHPEGALGEGLLPLSAGAENGVMVNGDVAMNGGIAYQPDTIQV